MKAASLLALAVLAGALSSTANAANGTLQFQGNLQTGSCGIVPVDFTQPGLVDFVDVDMGQASFADMQEAAAVTGVVNNPERIAFNLECNGADDATRFVNLKFDTANGSGLDRIDNRLLALAPGGAGGAAIALVDNNNRLIDLSSAPELRERLGVSVPGAARFANFRFGAAYLKTSAAPVEGVANATLPFLVTYE